VEEEEEEGKGVDEMVGRITRSDRAQCERQKETSGQRRTQLCKASWVAGRRCKHTPFAPQQHWRKLDDRKGGGASQQQLLAPLLPHTSNNQQCGAYCHRCCHLPERTLRAAGQTRSTTIKANRPLQSSVDPPHHLTYHVDDCAALQDDQR
jgi:hypothetical protein